MFQELVMSDLQLLSLREASEMYKIPVTTLRDAVYRGDIAVRKVGNQLIVEAQLYCGGTGAILQDHLCHEADTFQ